MLIECVPMATTFDLINHCLLEKLPFFENSRQSLLQYYFNFFCDKDY